MFQVSISGFLSLEYEPLFDKFGPETPEQWKNKTNGQVVVAPLWANFDPRNISGGGLFVYVLSEKDGNNDTKADLEFIGNITSAYLENMFQPTLAIVTLWQNVTLWSSVPASEHVKTQVRLVMLLKRVCLYMLKSFMVHCILCVEIKVVNIIIHVVSRDVFHHFTNNVLKTNFLDDKFIIN